MENSLPFSRITFAGIQKKEKVCLRAMKKPENVSAPPGFFAKFRNPLKKDEPQPKKVILTNVPHRYNPVTKKYEFEGDTEEMKEEFVPPPIKFVNKGGTGPVKKYVDVIGQDVNLCDYKPGNLDKDEEEKSVKVIDEQKIFEEILRSAEPQDLPNHPQKEETNYKQLFLEQKEQNQAFLQESLKLLQINDQDTPDFFSFQIEKIESELAELNFSLIKKIQENFLIQEKNFHLENEIQDLKVQNEMIFKESSEVLDRLKDENRNLLHELNVLTERRGSLDNETGNRIHELEKTIEMQQIRINFETQSRVKSEISEQKLIFLIKDLENNLAFALETIKDLTEKDLKHSSEQMKMTAEFINSSISSADTFEIFELTTENLSLKVELESLQKELSLARGREKDLSNKLKIKIEEFSELEEIFEHNREKIVKENQIKVEERAKQLNSRFAVEKNNFLNEIQTLNSIISEQRQTIHDLKVKENESDIFKDELKNELISMQRENSSLLNTEKILLESEKQLKITFSELKNENFKLKAASERLTEETFAMSHKLEDQKQEYNKLMAKHKTMVADSERKLLEASSKLQTTETKLRSRIDHQENSLKSLELDLKSAESKILELKETQSEKEKNLLDEISRLKLQLVSENEEKTILKQELEITTDSLNAELSSLRKKHEQQIMTVERLEQEVTENCGILEINKKLEVELELKNTKNIELNNRIKENFKEISILNEKIEDLESEKNSLTTLLAGSSDETLVLRDDLRSSQEEAETLKNILKSFEKTAEDSQNLLKITQNRIELLEKIIQEKNFILEKNLMEKKNLDEEIARIRTENENFEESQTESSTIFSEFCQEFNDLQRNLQQVFQENEELKISVMKNKDLVVQLKMKKEEMGLYFEEERLRSERMKNEILQENIKILEEVRKLEKKVMNLQQIIENLKKSDRSQEFQMVLSENEKKIHGLQAILSEKEKKLLELQAILSEKEKKLFDLQAILSEKDKKLFDFHAILSEKDKKLFDVQAILSEKDKKIFDLQAILSEKDKKILDLHETLKSQGPSASISSLESSKSTLESLLQNEESKVKSLSKELLTEKSKTSTLLEDLKKSSETKNSLLSEISSLQKELHSSNITKKSLDSLQKTCELLEKEKKTLEEKLFSLEQEQKALQDPKISSFSPDPHFFSSFQHEKYELELKIEELEEEKRSLITQIDDLSSENDQLYEKNLFLNSQNQVLLQESKKDRDFSTFQEISKKLNEKEEELMLVKENFHDLLQQKTEDHAKKVVNHPPEPSGWFSSVLGQIFLTDKERGLSTSCKSLN